MIIKIEEFTKSEKRKRNSNEKIFQHQMAQFEKKGSNWNFILFDDFYQQFIQSIIYNGKKMK